MRDKFIKYAETLIDNVENSTEIIDDLKSTFHDCGMFHEEGACLEKLFHMTNDPRLFIELGNIFQYKLLNNTVANAAYNRFLYNTDKDFFNHYAKNLSALGYNYIDTENQEDKNPKELTYLCDKFDLIVYMMICLKVNKEYDAILELVPYLIKVKKQIADFKSDSVSDTDYINEIEYTEKHLSDILSEIRNRNDINNFAIDLNSENARAYINIIDDMITYKNYNEAKIFFNDAYCKAFNKTKLDSIVKICWNLSDYYKDRYEFYDAVRFQKIALELEICEEKV